MNKNRLDIKTDYKKTPVEVLLFADDLIPKNHWEVQLTHDHFVQVGYKQVEKIQDIYTNVCDGIYETCDERIRRMRQHSVKSYTFGSTTARPKSDLWL